MSKQPTQPQGAHRESPETDRNTKQSRDGQDRAKDSAERELAEQQVQEGGEESKHGRKQKGNIDDT